ncbi:type II secretion system GspH family protein [Patescibacteria group bacterium]|nr:type II secretion system GspH family protein [Patescibacteria group bacterium]
MKNKGFTLIELLVVISIIGVLAGMAAFNFQQARERARDVQRKSDLKQLQNALESYKNDQPSVHYPDTGNLASLIPNHIKRIPMDPKQQKLNGSWVDYSYVRTVGETLEYDLVACLENAGDLSKDATNNVICTSGVSYTLTEP